MILEVLRLTSDYIATNINAQLALVPRDTADAIPPDITAVVDSTRSLAVALQRYPDTFPCITVNMTDTVALDGEVISGYRDATVTVLVRYIMKDVHAEQGNTTSYYSLRALQQVLTAFHSNANAHNRTRNAIQILECMELEHVPLFENIDDAFCTGALRVTYKVRDTAP